MENKKTILIVEDEVPLLNALHEKLMRNGFITIEARNGEQGLEAAIREHPDLILLDIIMPKMDGMTMFKKLRNENEWGKSVPVIILTNLGSADEARNKDATELEPSHYLVKTDWTLEEVVTKIRERLEE
ncbi:MAG: response regulator [Candidatus Liptonbacteria bacterium]|nr:response regulator [Candidatus Liptonbacteria bacterium]